MTSADTSDFLFIDAILLSYRLGNVRCDEQKQALLMAARSAIDSISFLTTVERLGIGKRSQLHTFLGQYLAAPAYYRAKYPLVLGLREEGVQPPSFLGNMQVLSLVEALLSSKQQDVFYDSYWWFVHNHQPTFQDIRKGNCIGAYATDPQDNASTLVRFDEYLHYLVNHKTQRIRERFEGFPADMVIAVLKRAFL